MVPNAARSIDGGVRSAGCEFSSALILVIAKEANRSLIVEYGEQAAAFARQVVNDGPSSIIEFASAGAD